jgi:hypothetical protein
MESQETIQWCAKRFGIPEEDVVWYSSGICYDRICVKTKESADKVTEKVKGQTANGGMFDGMPLGGQTKTEDGYYNVYC